MYKKYFKRCIDIILSAFAMTVLSPIYLIIAVAIKIDSPGPVFFRQRRVGIRKSYFYIWKFRTMQVNAPQNVPTHLLSHPEQYITKVGRILRKSSLDELPQIVQIFEGKMSIIGPRPALWNQYDLIAERDRFGINDIRPGLTGWAQINGRDELSISEKVAYDREYKNNLIFNMDFMCFLRSIKSVLKGTGVVEGGVRKERH